MGQPVPQLADHPRQVVRDPERVGLLGRAVRVEDLVVDVDRREQLAAHNAPRLLLVEGRSYLEGWCRRADAVRLFRLDRILALQILELAAEVPAGAEPVDVDGGLFRPSPQDVLVELELAAAGRWVAEYFPCERAEDLPDGRLRITLRTPDTQMVRRLALRLGEDGRVVAPAELAAQVSDDATAALAHYA